MKALAPELVRSAVEAAVWCKQRLRGGADPKCLRSVELRPSQELVGGDSIHVTVVDSSAAIRIVEEVVAQRRRALQDKGWLWSGETLENLEGRLLIFHHDLTLSDGGAEDPSHGLFDVHNQPPWDTWVGYLEGEDSYASGLISCVPRRLVRAAENGIYANPERSVEWF
jgi:hypothetical protein